MNVHITLINSNPEKQQKCLLLEAPGKGVLDSGCSKTVAGQIWYTEYVSTLSEGDRQTVKETSGKSVFRFGDGKESKSLMLATIPVLI